MNFKLKSPHSKNESLIIFYKKMEGKIDKFKSEIEELGFSVSKPVISSQKFVYFDCTKN